MSAGTREPPGSGPALPGGPGTDPPARDVPSAPGVSRVTVLAPRTRVDVALPSDVPVAELVGALLDMAGEPPGPGPGWTLALLGEAPADPEHTLAGLGVLDGDQLVLRRPADAAPAPLYDDVVDAVAEATPPAYRAWGPAAAHRAATAALGVAAAVAITALFTVGRGPGTAGGALTAAVAGVLAVGSIALAAAASRLFARETVAGVLAVAGVVAAGVGGVAAVPAAGDGPATAVPTALLASAGSPHLLLGAVLVTVAALAALAAAGTADRRVLAVLVALAAAGVLGATVGVVAVAAGALAPPGGGPDPTAVAAGVGAAATIGLAALPRAAIAVARLPLPSVPGSARELAEDDDAVPHAEIERRADRAHAAMTGLVLGVAAGVVAACAVLAAVPAAGLRGVLGWVLAALLVALLALRSRTYANAVQAGVLLLGAVLAGAAVLLGALRELPAGVAGLAVVGLAVLGGAGCALLGSTRRRPSPSARRAVGITEAVAIAAVLPLALGVMDLYTVMRLL